MTPTKEGEGRGHIVAAAHLQLVYDNLGKSVPIFTFFTAKFRNDMWREKLELKQVFSYLLLSVFFLLAKSKCLTKQLYIHISHVRRYVS